MKLCTILARGGSVGVPGKNIRLINGKPLIEWSIQQAVESRLFDLIVVSSDSPEILNISKKAGAGFTILRPEKFSRTDSPKMPALHHCVVEAEIYANAKFEQIIDLQPTSPLRTSEDIVNASKLQISTDASSVITGTLSKCSPYFSLVEENSNGTVSISKVMDIPIHRRQDCPRCYDMNGSIYVFDRDSFMESLSIFYPDTKLYEMPEERSIDIDTELDFEIASFLMTKKKMTNR